MKKSTYKKCFIYFLTNLLFVSKFNLFELIDKAFRLFLCLLLYLIVFCCNILKSLP